MARPSGGITALSPPCEDDRDDTGRASPGHRLRRFRRPHWRVFRWLVRTGFVARAITYGVIGVLAMAMALQARHLGASADQQGALVLLARTPLGHSALVAVALGLLAYALWKFQHGIFCRGPEGAQSGGLKDRVANLGGGMVYLGFFVITIRALTGTVGNSTQDQRHAAAGVLAWPGGPELIAAAGLTLVIVSLFQVYEAVKGKFADECQIDHLADGHCRVFMMLGRVGLVARAVVFALVGYFVLRTAADYEPSSAVGLGGALVRLERQPLGTWLVGTAAVGLLIFSLFSFAEARYRQL